jgi:Tfp pilus assembly protein PilO
MVTAELRQSLREVEPRSLGLILMLTGFLVVVALSLYVVKPQYQSFNDKSVSFDMLHSQIDDQAQLQHVIEEERNNIKALQLQLHGEAGEMPVNEIEAYLVGRLQGLAWDVGIELFGVRPGQAKRILEFEEISFKVDVIGEYKNLYQWLEKIGDTLGFMLVSNYEISLVGSRREKENLKMHVTIVFYRVVDI